MQKKEIYNANNFNKNSREKLGSLKLPKQFSDQQLSKRNYQSTFPMKNHRQSRMKPGEFKNGERDPMRAPFWTTNAFPDGCLNSGPSPSKFLDFKLENKHRVNSPFETKINFRVKHSMEKNQFGENSPDAGRNDESPKSPRNPSQNLASFWLKRNKKGELWDQSNMEIIFPHEPLPQKLSRNDIYTRSYRIDEHCEMFQKVVDLSQIYTDCPDMFQTRQDYIFWIIESVSTYRMIKEPQVLSRAIQILDSLFCKSQMNKIRKEVLTKIGITSIWIAAKYEGVKLSLEKLMRKLDPGLKRKFHMSPMAILACENMILREIDFRISAPVHSDFVENFLFRIFYWKSPLEPPSQSLDFVKNSSFVVDPRLGSEFIKGNKFKFSKECLNNNENKIDQERRNEAKLQLPKKLDKKTGTPISFTEFKKRIQNFKKKRKQKKQNDKIKQPNRANKNRSTRPQLESLMRKYTLYFLKLLYHTIESCKEAHKGALACVFLALKQLMHLPAKSFAAMEGTFSEKCIFFIKSLKGEFGPVPVVFENVSVEDPPTSNFYKQINESDNCSQKSQTQCVISETQSTKRKEAGDKSSTKSHRSSPLREPLLVRKLPAQFRLEKELISNWSRNCDEGSISEQILLKNTQRMADSEKLRFSVRGVQLHWERQPREVRNLFLKQQSLEFLNQKLRQILRKYSFDVIEDISKKVIGIERQFLNQKSRSRFLKRIHPNPNFLLNQVHLF